MFYLHIRSVVTNTSEGLVALDERRRLGLSDDVYLYTQHMHVKFSVSKEFARRHYAHDEHAVEVCVCINLRDIPAGALRPSPHGLEKGEVEFVKVEEMSADTMSALLAAAEAAL